MIQRQPNSTDVIAALNFEPHVEGGYYRRHSDILDYFHRGDAIEYNLIHAYGSLQTLVMSSDVLAGQQFLMHVPGRIWKASRLLEGSNGFGLISVVVSPGFEFADLEIGDRKELTARFPQHGALIEELTRGDE
jgi:predicted cupin superfamily sugar epimerase